MGPPHPLPILLGELSPDCIQKVGFSAHFSPLVTNSNRPDKLILISNLVIFRMLSGFASAGFHPGNRSSILLGATNNKTTLDEN